MINWTKQADLITSKGLTADKAGSLAGLHERRRQTESQYFTPKWVAAGIWQMLSGQDAEGNLSVIDTSVGSGRLIEGAPIEAFISGCDVDANCIEALNSDAAAAGRNYRFKCAGLEDISFHGYTFAIINPPFSIQLSSPLLKAYPCTSFGRFGANTSAKSHEYALWQARAGAAVTVALLPAAMEEELKKESNLVAVVKLPDNTFVEEGANVATAVFVFGDRHPRGDLIEVRVQKDQDWPVLPNMLRYHVSRPYFQVMGVDHELPVITAPVTGNRDVVLHKNKGRILPKFSCGLSEAMVMNAVLEANLYAPSREHRFPKGMRYEGQAQFEIDLHLCETDPIGSLNRLLEQIRSAGGKPRLAPSLEGYFKKRARKLARAVVPFEHWVKTTDTKLEMTAKRLAILDPADKATVVKRGTVVTAKPKDGNFSIHVGGRQFLLSRPKAAEMFDFEDERLGGTSWVCVAPGKIAAFPHLAKQYQNRFEEHGIDWLWEPQKNAIIEQCINPFGLIAAWQQGTGKARSAIAACLVHGGNSLVVVESALVAEMKREVKKIGLDASLYQFIEKPADTHVLRKVNFITYNKLKSVTRSTLRKVQIKGKRANQRYSDLLRRRINYMACDEGSVLANAQSLQSRGLQHVAAKKAVIFDGTPIRSYPRDILNQLQATAGQGVHQPYSNHNGHYLDKEVLVFPNKAERAIDSFQNHFVSYSWVTSQFREDMSEGAKREIPLIKDLDRYRKLLGPNVQRMLRTEPRMASYCYSESPVLNTPIEPRWDEGHLQFYLKTAMDFADWYMDYKKRAGEEGKKINLVAVLAKINAVVQAANCPHRGIKDWPVLYTPVTSKERAAVELCVKYAGQGKKTILYATSPATVARLHSLLNEKGIKSLPFTGEMDIKKRCLLLDSEFRFGDAQVLLSTWVGQRGLNLPQASRGIIYQRDWCGDTEQQAIERMCRPEQTDEVTVDYLHLPGSIDVYMAQVVEWKLAAADAGLDWGNMATSGDEFMHLDNVLVQFCKTTRGMSVQDMLRMKQAA